jgi:hypothetical protein
VSAAAEHMFPYAEDRWANDQAWMRHVDGPFRVYDSSPDEPLPAAFPLGFAPPPVAPAADVEVEPLLWEHDQA